ncbi:hypothetical protein [Pollutibacter soli]|uniref:hypothetical protein n=1 Tax=Pollutibacter soli TaxID=3034157 RepID=UPI003013A3FA
MDINRRKDELLRFSVPDSPALSFSGKDILDKEPDWNDIKYNLHTRPEIFEKAFFSIHIKKKSSFTPEQKQRAIQFFVLAYLITSDVRYFNEYLWFSDNGNTSANDHELCLAHFNKNCGKNKCHSIGPSELSITKDLLQGDVMRNGTHQPDTKLRVCLIGNPVFFGSIHRELKKAGFHVEQFFIPYHPNKYIRFIAGNPLLIKAASILKGNPYKFQTLNFDPKDERIKTILDERRFDIGFHKLNFIIRKNIIDSFRIALINDHWGMLPFLRGKSTIAWSVLLGFPVIPSLHFTETGIDSGPIIGYDQPDVSGINSLEGLRSKIRQTLTGRVVQAIKYLASPQFKAVPNRADQGHTYYEMHPWLVEYTEKEVLGKS